MSALTTSLHPGIGLDPSEKRRGICWTLTSVLEDLDYVDDMGLLSSRHIDIKDKTTRFKSTSELVGEQEKKESYQGQQQHRGACDDR